jgi:membrane-associated protein
VDVNLLLHSGWLLPVLAALVAVDAPFPMLPSEPMLLSAAALAFGAQDAAVVLGLFAAALLGSLAGDLFVFGLGRTSRRVTAESGLSRWVCRNVVHRTGLTLVGARFLPAGRLVSTLAAGRYGVPVGRFLPWSLVSSLAWSGYILAAGMLLGPLTHGDPLRSLLAGLAMAAVTAGAFSLARRLRARSPRADPAATS